AAPRGVVMRRLIRRLEIRELTASSALDIVIRAVSDQGFGRRSSEAEQVYAFMRRAWKQARREVEAMSQRLGVIRVPARKARGRAVEWKRADRVYFGREWTGTRTLESLYGRFS